jgi:hypothetical protein
MKYTKPDILALGDASRAITCQTSTKGSPHSDAGCGSGLNNNSPAYDLDE